ncbi:MAG: zinc ribbon domain-containing protein [Proteobacteria bacterium]|nr:zinc ribbon domain-containing protein [Pseudomonadota bacterium]
MPLYEFRCSSCGKVSEFQLKLADAYPNLCPACGQSALQKIMSLPAFQLKGGGWYKDAYDGKSNKRPEATPSADTKAAPSESASPAPAAPQSTPASPVGGSSTGGSSSSSSGGSTPSS